ncbi:MAG: hypothetical protein ACRCV0_05400 [Brevinema sp.]
MKFHLLLIILLISACAEKQTSSDSDAGNMIIENNTNALETDNIINTEEATTLFVSQEYIDKMDQLERENPNSLIARYDKGLDLILVDKSIYWDKKSHHYYYASIQKDTNKLIYSQDSNFQQEPIIVEQYKEFIINDIPLLYIGSISSLERVYINTNDNSTYLKRLTLIDDLFYLTDEQTPKTNQNINQVFPVVFILSSHDNCIDNPVATILYTNENIYSRNPMDMGMLKIKNENTSLEEMFIDLAPYFIIKEVYPTEHEFNG